MEEDYIGLEEDIAYESAEKSKKRNKAVYVMATVLLMLVTYVLITLSSYHG